MLRARLNACPLLSTAPMTSVRQREHTCTCKKTQRNGDGKTLPGSNTLPSW